MSEQASPWQVPTRKSFQASERRAAVRYAALLEASCQAIACGDGSLVHARVWDLSTTGISLVLDQQLEQDTLLSIALELTSRDFAPPLEARVVHVSPHLDHLWFLGCEFLIPLTSEELEALL